MADHLNICLGMSLRRRRRMLGLTQQQLGAIVGVRFQQIHKYECGANTISAPRLWQLAKALDVPVSYFYDALTRKAKPKPVANRPHAIGHPRA